MKKKIKIGALISGGGSNLQAIIDACEQGRIDGKIVFVGSDKPDVYGLERAKKHKIPTFVVDYGAIIVQEKKQRGSIDLPGDASLNELSIITQFYSDKVKDEEFFVDTRVYAEERLLQEMIRFDFDLIVLAGFMRVLTPYFIDRVNTDPDSPRIMNIHPALLPSFPGTDGYGDTFRYGCKVGGCTVHFVDYGEDTGPIIGQKSYTIELSDTEDTIRGKGLKLEHELYPKCIQLFAELKLRIVERKGRKIVEIFDERGIL